MVMAFRGSLQHSRSDGDLLIVDRSPRCMCRRKGSTGSCRACRTRSSATVSHSTADRPTARNNLDRGAPLLSWPAWSLAPLLCRRTTCSGRVQAKIGSGCTEWVSGCASPPARCPTPHLRAGVSCISLLKEHRWRTIISFQPSNRRRGRCSCFSFGLSPLACPVSWVSIHLPSHGVYVHF